MKPQRRRDYLKSLGSVGLVGLLAGCSGGDGSGGGDGDDAGMDSGMDDAETDSDMGGTTETDSGMADTETETEMDDTTETDDGMSETAALRVAHMSPNGPSVDVLVDGSAALEDVSFTTVSDYLDVPAGARRVQITAAGDADAVVFDGEVSVKAGTDYTVAAVGEVGDMVDRPFEPLVLTDDNSDPGGDTARVRVVHASPDAPAVDVTVNSTGDVLFDGVAFGESAYATVPAGDYTLQIRGDTMDGDGEVVADFDVSLNGGSVSTAFAAGYLTPDDEPADVSFDLVVARDSGSMG